MRATEGSATGVEAGEHGGVVGVAAEEGRVAHEAVEEGGELARRPHCGPDGGDAEPLQRVDQAERGALRELGEELAEAGAHHVAPLDVGGLRLPLEVGAQRRHGERDAVVEQRVGAPGEDLPLGRAAGVVREQRRRGDVDEGDGGGVAAERLLEPLALVAGQLGEQRLERGERELLLRRRGRRPRARRGAARGARPARRGDRSARAGGSRRSRRRAACRARSAASSARTSKLELAGPGVLAGEERLHPRRRQVAAERVAQEQRRRRARPGGGRRAPPRRRSRCAAARRRGCARAPARARRRPGARRGSAPRRARRIGRRARRA